MSYIITKYFCSIKETIKLWIQSGECHTNLEVWIFKKIDMFVVIPFHEMDPWYRSPPQSLIIIVDMWAINKFLAISMMDICIYKSVIFQFNHLKSCFLFIGHGSDTSNTTEEALKLIRRSLKSNSMNQVEGTHWDGTYPHVFVTFGASVSVFFFICIDIFHFDCLWLTFTFF